MKAGSLWTQSRGTGGTALPSPRVLPQRDPLSAGVVKAPMLPRAALTAGCHGLSLQDIPTTIKYRSSNSAPFQGSFLYL